MVATVEICESNTVGETITHNVTNLNCGSTDAPNIVVATYPITTNTNAYTKYVRLHWSASTANKIDNIQIWKSAGTYTTGITIDTNLRTSAYGGAVAFATPSQTTFTDQTMPVANPGAANLGIAGSLTGSLVAIGYSDYWKWQLHSTASTPAGDMTQLTFTIQYDEQ
jgi:hypothetical protein